MSAKSDRDTVYLEGEDNPMIACEQCGTMLTQLFAELQRHDKNGPYVICRGYCEKCDKEMWSRKIR